jgi:hypothetical protein
MGTILVKSMLIPANYITTDINQIVLVSVKDEILVEGDQVVISEDVDDRKPLEYKSFVEYIYGKLVGDRGYISRNLFERLFVDGIQLITKLKNNMKGALMSVSDKLLLRKRAIIETINDELKNIAQVEHSRHRCFDNFIVNILGALAAYCCFPKKPCINVNRTFDTQLSLF